MVYSPAALVVVERLRPVVELRIVTVAPATGSPDSLVTVPAISELVSCAFDATGIARRSVAAKAAIVSWPKDPKIDRSNRDWNVIIDPRCWKCAKAYSRNMTFRFRSNYFRAGSASMGSSPAVFLNVEALI